MNSEAMGNLGVCFKAESPKNVGLRCVAKSAPSKNLYRVLRTEDLLHFMEDKT